MKKITLLLSAMLLSVMSFAAEYSVTISFADKAQRTVYTNDQQVWEQNGIIVTNDKSESTTNVGDYANPARFYKSSALTVKCTLGTIKKMEFTCGTQSGKDYPAELVASVGSEATADGLVVTIVPTASSDTYTIAKFANQVRVASIKVTYEGEAPENGGDNSGDDNGGTTPPPANPEGVITCAEAVAICQATGETATTETYTIRGYVTEIKDAYNSTYGNISYWMADEKGGGQVLQAYRVKPVNDSDVNVKVNDYVEVVGTLVNYKGNTPEVNAGGTYTIITAGEEGEKPSLPTGLTGDGTMENPFTIEDVIALNNQFVGPYYVKAYIVGQVVGASLSTGAEFEAPFNPSTNNDGTVNTYNTNLLVASTLGETDAAKCVPVQLPTGDLRTNFNLPENPDMHGQEVLICGSLQKYFSVPGIKSPTSIELLSEVSNVVNVKGMQYADAYYYTEDEIGYFDFDMYVDVDPDTYEYTYPELYVAVKANSKTALNGTYDLLGACLWTSANDSIEMGEALGTVTIKNVDTEGNYSFTGSFVGADGKTYKFNDVMYVWGYDVDTDEEIAFSEESTTPPTPPTNGAIVFDADVDKGNAGTNSDNAAAYQITKNGVTLDVTSGILGTYNNENHYRIYKNQTLTVTSTVGNIAKIEFTCTANGDEKYGPGCFTASTGEYGHDGAAVGTWTGDAATITFTASANQVRATQIVVTLASATAVDNVTVGATPVKVIENGQVLIIRGENIYNVLGAQVK